MNWTQPVCWSCWIKENGEHTPIRMREPNPEICCKCGQQTVSGIYIRIDPNTVPYPTDKED